MAPDSETLTRAARGEREAFEAIYAQYGRGLFVFLAGYLRGREDAEDALQQTLLRAWAWLPTLKNRDKFVPWIFRIARNVANDAGSRRARSPGALSGQEDLLGAGADPAARTDEDDVKVLVAGLKPETRALVLLRAVEGWSAEDVALATGSSVATVRRRYAKALKFLRRKLEGSEPK